MKEYGMKQSVWKDKPETMIKKVAEAQALRQGFPDFFAGTYSDDEILQEKQVQQPRIIDEECNTKKLIQVLNIEPSENTTEFAPDAMASEEQVDRIITLFVEKKFNEQRIAKAMDYYGIEKLTDLPAEKAQHLITQLEKV